MKQTKQNRTLVATTLKQFRIILFIVVACISKTRIKKKKNASERSRVAFNGVRFIVSHTHTKTNTLYDWEFPRGRTSLIGNLSRSAVSTTTTPSPPPNTDGTVVNLV